MLKRSIVILGLCSAAAQGALTIQFDYSLDSSGFFSRPDPPVAGQPPPQGPGQESLKRRKVLEDAAKIFTDGLPSSTFSAINPQQMGGSWTVLFNNPTTGAMVMIENPTVPANTLKIFVGARSLTGSTLGRAQSPGYSAGGTASWLNFLDSKDSPTRFQPLGLASISFSSNESVWYFDNDTSTVEAFPGKFDFFSVAQHEIGHLLGFSAGSLAFSTQSVGPNFIGANATATFGGPVPISADRSHFFDGLKFQDKQLGLAPSLPPNFRASMSAMEFAVLRDLGYEFSPPVPPVLGTLTVVADNSSRGAVSGDFQGTTSREVGKNFTVMAIAKPGFEFAGWSGGVSSFDNPLTFQMAPGLTLRANFKPIFFPGWDGNYFGIFKGNAPRADTAAARATSGTWQIRLVNNGDFTGKVVLNGRATPFKGRLDPSGVWVKQFNTGLAAPLDLATLTIHNDIPSGTMTGIIEVPGSTATLNTRKTPVFNKISPAPFNGPYTVAFPREAIMSAPTPPQGTGFGVMTINVMGMARVVGKLADGAPFMFGSPLNVDNKVDFSAPVLRGLDYVEGTVAFSGALDQPDVAASMRWSRLPNFAPPKTLWNFGFDTKLIPLVNRWKKPPTGQRVLASLLAPDGLATVELGTGWASVMTQVTVSPLNVIKETELSPVGLKLKLNAANGSFSGSFIDAGPQPGVSPTARRSFNGVFLQKEMSARGFYPGKAPDLEDLNVPPRSVVTSEEITLTPEVAP